MPDVNAPESAAMAMLYANSAVRASANDTWAQMIVKPQAAMEPNSKRRIKRLRLSGFADSAPIMLAGTPTSTISIDHRDSANPASALLKRCQAKNRYVGSQARKANNSQQWPP